MGIWFLSALIIIRYFFAKGPARWPVCLDLERIHDAMWQISTGQIANYE